MTDKLHTEQLNAYLDGQGAAITADLRTLVEVNSVRSAPLPGKPFGKGGAAALTAAETIAAAHGYKAVNYDNYALELDMGDAPDLLLLAHLDVVEAGDGWTKPPFRLTVEGDTLYGRGTTDDKGPALACLYAMDACKAVLGMPKTGVRLVLGSGEETGSEDMEHYFSKRPKLPYTLSPDADYPLINLEKGRFVPTFTKTAANDGDAVLVSFTGGKTANIVPAKARARVKGVKTETLQTAANDARAETGVDFTVETRGDGTAEIFAVGVGAHAASPEKGNNAQTALLSLLLRLPLTENETFKTLRSLALLFPHGETDGKSMSVKQADTLSGALTLNFGVFSFENGVFTCGIDIRSPISAAEDTVKAPIAKKLAAAGFAFEGDPEMRPAHYVPADSPLVQTLLRVYEDHTGQKGECLAIGGGTYVHDVEGGVAFGVEFPGTDYRIHGADEFTRLSELLATAKMYADVIARLCY